nr:retrovirus-related Pol polyprotein from transposon TNT 1-94 [Tanacetum cinerariifolium]
MNPRGGGAAGYGGVQNRVGNANPGQARQVKCYNCNGTGHISRNYTQPKHLQNFEYYKDKMLLMQAQENGVALDAEQLLFLAGGQNNAIDDDVDEQPIQDLALNVDNMFQTDDCDAFNYDVNEASTAQIVFMANLLSVDPVTHEAGPSYDSDILSKVQYHDHYQDVVCAHHEEHAMHDNVQLNHIVDSRADYTSDGNMIPYDQYVKDNAIDIVINTDDVLPPGVENDDSDGEVDAVEELRVDNSISNSEHESFESEESDFDNPSVPLPPPEPPDEEFDFEIGFEDEISVEPSYNQDYNDNYYPHELPSFPCCDNYGGSHETFQCQPINQNIDFLGSDQIQTPQYPDVNLPSQEIDEEAFHAKEDLMKSIQIFLEEFSCIPFEENPQILLEAWFKFFAIKRAQPEDSNELFQKLLEDLKELAEYKESLENSSKEIAVSNSNQEKEDPPKDSDVRHLIREECCVEVSEEQKQKMEDTILELVKICRQKELYCIHDNVDDLIESALNSKLFSINSNSQRLDKKEQEVENVVEQPVERGTRVKKSLQNFRVIHDSSNILNNTSQISLVHEIAPILSTKEPDHSLSMGYEHLSITPETKSDEVIESNTENLLPIPSECEVTSEDEKSLPEEDFLAEEFKVYSNPLFNEDEINYDKLDPHCFNVESDFVESLLNRDTFIDSSSKLDFSGELAHVNPEITESDFDFEEEIHLSESLLYDNSSSRPPKEHNVEEERIKREHADHISHMEMLFTINPRPRPTVNVNTNVESLPSLPIPVQDNDSQREEIDIVINTDDVLPPGVENDDSDGEVNDVEELRVDNSISNSEHESSESEESDFDNPSVLLPPSEPPDENFDFEIDFGDEISVVRNTIVELECIDARVKFDVSNDKNDVYSYFMFDKVFSFLFAESKDTIFDPDTMVDVNVDAPADQAPTMAPAIRTDDQILPHIRWVPIGKSNRYLDVEKSQSNPIFKISVDILKHTNFFRAFTASSTIPSIYIQQFWDIVRYDKSAGCYRCKLNEQWFDLTKDTLRDALQITPVINNQTFTSPPSSDALINFVNELRYPKLVRNLSNVVTNDMLQPWRALTTIINLCLTGKTSEFERPRAPVLQILWGIVNRAHIDYAERIWEEFAQSIHTFIEDKRNLAHHTHGKKKATLIVILNLRPQVSKPASTKQPEPKFAPAKTQGKKRKLTTEISDKPSKAKKSRPGLVSKRRKPVISLRALEESLKSMYDVPRGPLPPVVIREPESEKYQPLIEVPGKGKEKVIEEQVSRDLLTLQTPKKKSPADRYIFQRRTSTPTGSSGHNESSSLYAELGLMDSEEESEEDVPGAYAGGQGEGQARPDPGAQDEDQTGSNPDE